MNKLNIILKLGLKFFVKYLKEYYLLMVKPIFMATFGFIIFGLIYINPMFAILALLITLPCIFYSFWRGYMITYALNYLAYDFIKENKGITLKDCYALVRKEEKSLAMYVGFIAIITIIGYLPTGILFLSDPEILSLLEKGINSKMILIYSINTLFLLPFINYALQAYYFRKEKESFYKLLINCYKKQNFTGYFIAFIVVNGVTLLGANVFLLPLTLALNIFVYGINMFWYLSRENN